MSKKLFTTFLIWVFPEMVLASASTKGGTEYVQTIFKVIAYILVLIFVLFVALYGTKFIAKRSKTFFKGKYIEIIDSINLGSNNRIVIAKIANYIYILSINNNQTTLIDKMKMKSFYFNDEDDDMGTKENYSYFNNGVETYDSMKDFESKFKKIFDKFKLINTKIDKDEEENEEDN